MGREIKDIGGTAMSIADVRFNTKSDFVAFVKHAAERKNEYLEARRNGMSSEQLNQKGFKTVAFL